MCLDATVVLRGQSWAALTFYSCVGTGREKEGWLGPGSTAIFGKQRGPCLSLWRSGSRAKSQGKQGRGVGRRRALAAECSDLRLQTGCSLTPQ